MTTLPHTPKPLVTTPSLQESFRKAAKVHDLASHHYIEAARLHDKGDHAAARIHANLAEDHAVAALDAGAVTFGS